MPSPYTSLPPTLFPEMPIDAESSGSTLIATRNGDGPTPDAGELMEQMIGYATRAGCTFLFEIPGHLFDAPGHRAAALVYVTSDRDPEMLYVLCDETDLSISVLTEHEASDDVEAFVRSYGGVLSVLNRLETVQALH